MNQKRHTTYQLTSDTRFQVALVGEGMLVGLFVGLTIALYRFTLMQAESVVQYVVHLAQTSPLIACGWFGILILLTLVVGVILRWEPDAAGSGIPQVDAEVMGAQDMNWMRVLGAKFMSGALCGLGGLSLGREGPSVQLGGVIGKGFSRLCKRGRGEERLLVTCGASAGMAAAFHAPLTGVMFTLEEIHKSFTAPLILVVMSSAVMADYVSAQLLGLSPLIQLHFIENFPYQMYYVLILFGIAMGILGALHNWGMFALQDVLSRIRVCEPFIRLLIPFLLSGIVGLCVPLLLCGGDALLELLENTQSISLLILVGLLAGKYLFTGICFGAGAPGGTLLPLVAMGALGGLILGKGFLFVFGMPQDLLQNCTLFGIVGFFSGAVKAPVTAVVLAFELTGSPQALLSLSLVSLIAYVTANLLKSDAYYEHSLGRLLGVSTDEADSRWGAQGRQLHTFVVETDSPLVGHSVSEVSWPEGSLVVTMTRCGHDLVPHSTTVFQAHDTLLVLIDADANLKSESHIRALCRANQ